jgi:5'-AMP-activated protein kinase catalytic alpha subunit
VIQDFIKERVREEDVYDIYNEEEALGEGAYGKVWKAEHIDTGEFYAIKTIDTPDERALGREIKVMLEADHENLVRVHDIFRMDGQLHLVMDLVEPVEGLDQSDLFEYVIQKGPLTFKQACQLLYQTCAALEFLNGKAVIHRDLKPENILLGTELFDRTRLVDYGLARVFVDGLQDENQGTANVGSDGYQAPETMSRGGGVATYGKQCDVWSLGVVMYICMAKAPPFGLGPSAKLTEIRAGRYKPMTGPKWANVDERLKELIKRMITVDPHQRITVEEIMHTDWVRAGAGMPPSDPMELELARDLARTASK